jgi:hypothetical protein
VHYARGEVPRLGPLPAAGPRRTAHQEALHKTHALSARFLNQARADSATTVSQIEQYVVEQQLKHKSKHQSLTELYSVIAVATGPRLSNEDEDKRQCTAGDEGKTNDACVFDLRSCFWFRVGLDIVKLRMGLD